jgi:general secretion pathway protein E
MKDTNSITEEIYRPDREIEKTVDIGEESLKSKLPICSIIGEKPTKKALEAIEKLKGMGYVSDRNEPWLPISTYGGFLVFAHYRGLDPEEIWSLPKDCFIRVLITKTDYDNLIENRFKDTLNEWMQGAFSKSSEQKKKKEFYHFDRESFYHDLGIELEEWAKAMVDARKSIIPLSEIRVDYDVFSRIPEVIVRKFSAVLYGVSNGVAYCLTGGNFTDRQLLAHIKMRLKDEHIRHCVLSYANAGEVSSLIDQMYKQGEAVDFSILDEEEEDEDHKIEKGILHLPDRRINKDAVDTPEMRLKLLMQTAVDRGSSDLHVDVNRRKNGEIYMRSRIRINGQAQEITPFDARHIDFLSRVIKNTTESSSMKTTEERMPQDGKMTLRYKGEDMECRIVIMPAKAGGLIYQRIVIRVLKPTVEIKDFSSVGYPEHLYNAIKSVMKKGQGIILVTGPTGSGKSTTLKSITRLVMSDTNVVYTIEDPIEEELTGATQLEINKEIDLTYEFWLEKILRADPDIVLLGEVRNRETLNATVQLSNTGHLVLSTLHTNSALESIDRVLGMGVSPVQLMKAIKGVVAQRLVPCLCKSCRERETSTNLGKENATFARKLISSYVKENELYLGTYANLDTLYAKDFRMRMEALQKYVENPLHETYSVGSGCQAKGCVNGIASRKAIAEYYPVTDNMETAVRSEKSMIEVEKMMKAEGFWSMDLYLLYEYVQGNTAWEETYKWLNYEIYV